MREALLAAGGMGRVYLAFDQRLGRWLALKEALDTPEAAAALAREAQVTAALDHPGVVSVHDIGETPDGRPYYVMRLVRGRTLGTVVEERSGLDARVALLTHFRDACQAVAYAHSQGILHRDLKPANILVGEFGETQVVDWGLAVPVDAARGEVVGTPAWMAPEQARGEASDRRTDVWGLGAVLYHLLTASPPRPGNDPDDVLARAPHEAPRPVLVQTPDAPPELAAIASRALQLDPADRYADAQAVAEDVERYLTGRRVAAHQYSAGELLQRFTRVWRAPILVAAVALALLTVLLVSAARRLGDERDRAVAAEADAERALEVSLVSQARQAMAMGEPALAGVLGAAALQLGEHAEARGAVLAARAQWPAERVSVQPIGDCPNPLLLPQGTLCRSSFAVWHQEDGEVLWQTDVQAVSLHTSGPRIAAQRTTDVALLDAATGATIGTFPRRSALPLVGAEDGRFATRRWEGESWSGTLDGPLRPLDGCAGHGLPRDATLHPTLDLHAAWCADGHVAITDPDGAVAVFPTGLDVSEHGDVSALRWSPDGEHLALGFYRGRIAWLSRVTGEVRSSSPSRTAGIAQLAVSSDGALLGVRQQGGGVDVWSTDPLVVVASLPVADVVDLRWTDADHLRTLSDADTTWHIQRGATAPILHDTLGVARVLYTPDGRTLLTTHSDGLVVAHARRPGGLSFRQVVGRGVVLAAATTIAGDELVFAPGEERDAVRLSFDGTRLADLPEAGGSRAVVPLSGGRLLALPFQGGVERYEADGRLTPTGCATKEWRSAAAAPALDLVVAVAVDGEVVAVRDGTCGPPVPGLRARRAALDPGGAWLVAATADGLVRTDFMGSVAWRSPLVADQALDLAVSPDGRWIAAGGLDQTGRLYDARDGRLVAALRGHAGRLSAVAFSPDGTELATGSWDGTTRVWSLDALGVDAREVQARFRELGWPTVEALQR